MSPKEQPGKRQLSVVLPEDLMERTRNVVYWSPGLTVAAIVEAGLRIIVERMERANKGPYRPRPKRRLRAGRPIAEPRNSDAGKRKAR